MSSGQAGVAFLATQKDGPVILESQLTTQEKQELPLHGVDLTQIVVITKKRLPNLEDFLAVDEQGRHIILQTV